MWNREHATYIICDILRHTYEWAYEHYAKRSIWTTRMFDLLAAAHLGLHGMMVPPVAAAYGDHTQLGGPCRGTTLLCR